MTRTTDTFIKDLRRDCLLLESFGKPLARKLKSLRPILIRVRDGFKELHERKRLGEIPRDTKIRGCTSFKHFVRLRLPDHSVRSVFRMLAPDKRSEKAAGDETSPITALYRILSSLVGSGEASLSNISRYMAAFDMSAEQQKQVAALDNMILNTLPELWRRIRKPQKVTAISA